MDPNSKNRAEMAPQAHAVASGSSDGVKILLADERVDTGIMDNKGLNALDPTENYYSGSWNVKCIRMRMGLHDSSGSEVESGDSGGYLNDSDEDETTSEWVDENVDEG